MTGLKNLLFTKWVFIFIGTVGLISLISEADTSTNLSTKSPRTKVIFYSMPSLTKLPSKNTTINESPSGNTISNYTVEYLDYEVLVPEDPHHCQNASTIPCDPSYPYRLINGNCNNLLHPTWGSADDCYLRFQPAYYADHNSLRRSSTGNPLPGPREISRNIFKNDHKTFSNASLMFTLYGQTVAHDLSQASTNQLDIDCCSSKRVDETYPSCIPILMSSNDSFYSQFNVTCISMHRTTPCVICNTTNREQANVATAALDASMIYGNNNSRAMEIRANDGTGKLILNITENGDLLPTDTDAFKIFCPQKEKFTCFFSGDVRINQHSALSGIITNYVREHNRIATELKTLNPHWEEERLFQEARRITIATLQCITYKEYLPKLIGPYLMNRFNLTLKNGTAGSKYNHNVRLGIFNEFATAVFRLHNMVPKTVGAMNLRFKDMFLNPEIIRAGHMEKILRGFCKVPSRKYDHYFTDDVTDYLGWHAQSPYGSDLSAIDLQRGRDHGVAPYVAMVRFCSEGQVNISTFDDLAPLLMTKKQVEILEKNYETVHDIDLFVGVLMERHFPGSEVGPTTACLLAKQFYVEKFGDRFFFEHEGEVPSFTPAQRQSLKKCSLPRLLCDNSNITHIQKNIMSVPSAMNPVVPCSNFPKIDLVLWKESSSV